MPAVSSTEFLLQLGTGTPLTYTTFAGINSTSISGSHEAIEVTNIGSNGWKEMMAGPGTRSFSISGSGFAYFGTEWDTIQANFLAGTLTPFRILSGTEETPTVVFTGSWKITSLEVSGSIGEAVSISISLESSGPVTIA